MIKTDIYIGLNDLDTKQQKFSTSKYLSVLKKVCRIYGVPFSVSVIEGGYVHENGEYTEENSLVLSLIDADPAKIKEIAEDLCTFFHQESVLVTRGEVEAFSIKSSIKESDK